MKINNRIIGYNNPPYIIAELSANHNGSLDRAIETISYAKKCGADAVKIQTYTADTITINCDSPDFIIKGGIWSGYKLYDLYKWAETPYEWHKLLFAHAKKIGITIFSTPFDESAVDLLENLNSPAYKIASFEIVDLPLIRYVAKTGKPIILSTGMATEDEIAEAVDVAKSEGSKDLALLHCVSSYPAPLEEANLLQIPNLAKRFDVISGLSDHTLGTIAPIAAVANGASIIEKHFTIDRNDKGPDSNFSLEPPEFKKLCLDAKAAWTARGKSNFERQKSEIPNKIFRRSLYFIKNLKKNHIIGTDDIKSIRPGLGLPPKYYEKLIGKKLSRNVLFGEPVKINDFEL